MDSLSSLQSLMPVAAFLLALLVSVTVIPIAIRFAPHLGMIDQPDPRKVHRAPIARVGGMGIAAGTLLALILLAPRTPFTLAFGLSASLLAAFGAWDDARELHHYPKFIGQIAAAALVVWYGDVWIERVPFFDVSLPAVIGKPFTVFALVGVINAVNHADGLDGLAGGEALLSLGAISCLAYVTDSLPFLIFTAAVGGGLLGFIRYNTYPARVFMGDLGSQFLGFSVGVFAIALTQQVNPSISKSAALLLVGLPVADILAVLYQRVRGGMNWFRATRNHIHHRLLDLGFDHYQAVLAIYSVQAALTFLAVLVCYESDLLILGLYLGTVAAVFIGLSWAERHHWRLSHAGPSWPTRVVEALHDNSKLIDGLQMFVQFTIPAFLVVAGAAVSADTPISSLRLYALALIVLLVVAIIAGDRRLPVVFRLALYSSVGMIAYCIYSDPPTLNFVGTVVNSAYFLTLAAAIALIAVLGRERDFSVTNMDFLIVVALVTSAIFSEHVIGAATFWAVAIGTTVLFYGCELIIMRGNAIWNRILGTSAAGALGIILGKILI